MNHRSLLTFGRIVFAILGMISALLTLQGIFWIAGGSQMFHSQPTDGEDLTPLGGAALEMIGTLLVVFGSLFTILFIGLFRMLGKKLKPSAQPKR